MFKVATLTLVVSLTLIGGAVGCHREEPPTPPDTNNEANVSNNDAGFIQNATSNNESATTENAPTTGATTETATTEATTENSADNTSDNTAGNYSNDAGNYAGNTSGNEAGNVPPPGEEKTYVVKSGDSLWTIAKAQYKDGSKADLIAKANPTVNAGNLKVGTKLIIPPLPTTGGDKVTGGTPTDGETYVIQAGDSLYTIAQKHYGNGAKSKLIEQANPGLKPNALKVGAKIVLPPDTGGSTSRPAHTGRTTPTPHKTSTDDDGPPRPHFR